MRVYLQDEDGNYKAQLWAIAKDLIKHTYWQSKMKMWHIRKKVEFVPFCDTGTLLRALGHKDLWSCSGSMVEKYP